MVRNVAFLLLTLANAVVGNPTVQLQNGIVEGFTYVVDNSTQVDTYLGIRYAEASRFLDPVDVKPWTETHKAKDFPASCPFYMTPTLMKMLPMINKAQSEDCLFLNVWVPQVKTGKVAVLVFIYGGAFAFGSTAYERYHGALLAARENVVVVTINYRTNAFGFLYLDDDTASGNQGLKDQAFALKWISENIHSFGGDADRVTISGQSAGAASVGFHLLNEGTRNYFHRALLMSGSAGTSWSSESKEDARKKSLDFAQKVGCESQDVKQVYNCLADKSMEELVVGLSQLVNAGVGLRHFVPVVDGQFVEEDPNVLLVKQAGKINKDIIVGVTSDDGAFIPLLAGVLKDPNLLTPHTFTAYHKHMVREELSPRVTEEINKLYLDCDGKDGASVRDAIVKFTTDYMFICSAELLVETLTTHGDSRVYYYQFKHRPQDSVWPKWLESVHGDDVAFVFGHPRSLKSKFNEEDKRLAKTVTGMVGNFVRNGNPNEPRVTTTWYQYERRNQLRLDFYNDPVSETGSLRPNHCSYWNQEYPNSVLGQ